MIIHDVPLCLYHQDNLANLIESVASTRLQFVIISLLASTDVDAEAWERIDRCLSGPQHEFLQGVAILADPFLSENGITENMSLPRLYERGIVQENNAPLLYLPSSAYLSSDFSDDVRF